MDNSKRAEKIIGTIIDALGLTRSKARMMPTGTLAKITSQLDEAVREVENFQAMRIIEVEKHCADNAFKYGFAAAREKAAGIAEAWDGIALEYESITGAIEDSKQEIAERIRAMTPTSTEEVDK